MPRAVTTLKNHGVLSNIPLTESNSPKMETNLYIAFEFYLPFNRTFGQLSRDNVLEAHRVQPLLGNSRALRGTRHIVLEGKHIATAIILSSLFTGVATKNDLKLVLAKRLALFHGCYTDDPCEAFGL